MTDDKALALVPRTINEATALSAQLVQSGLLPEQIKSAQQAFAIITMGAELGLAPWAALNGINVIRGKPTISGQLMLALVRKSGLLAAFEIVERAPERCTIMMQRRGEAPATLTFTMQEAAALGLAGKDNYKKQPAVMLQWRCVAALCRLLFPDLLQGFVYTPEEIDPDLPIDEDGAIEDGYVVEYNQTIREDYIEREAALNGRPPTPEEPPAQHVTLDEAGDKSSPESEYEQRAVLNQKRAIFNDPDKLARVRAQMEGGAAQQLAIRLGNVIAEIYDDDFCASVGEVSKTAFRDAARYRLMSYLLGLQVPIGKSEELTPEQFGAVWWWEDQHQRLGDIFYVVNDLLGYITEQGIY